jgi:hypothetical protein
MSNRGFSNYCSTHQHNATITSFLNKMYVDMKRRISGKTKDRRYYLGKSILDKDVFTTWAKNHPDFLKLYKQYYTAKFERRLAPTVNRMDSNKGYTLDNMEWMSLSHNCMMASSLRKMNNKQRQVIYEILGVSNGKK